MQKIVEEFPDVSLVAMVAHEFKSPLACILAVEEQLEESCSSERQKKLLKKLRVSTDVMQLLANDILNFAQLRAGCLSYNPRPFYLKSLTEKLAALFELQFSSDKLDFIETYNFDSTLCVVCDEVRLLQVLANIISNARKFTYEGHVSVSIEQLHNANSISFEPNDQVACLRFCVEDTGIGIPEHELENLFKPFVQLENRESISHIGTGLGLAVSKAIVEEMGGNIKAASTLGEGTSFSFTITVPCIQLAHGDELGHEDVYPVPLYGNKWK